MLIKSKVIFIILERDVIEFCHMSQCHSVSHDQCDIEVRGYTPKSLNQNFKLPPRLGSSPWFRTNTPRPSGVLWLKRGYRYNCRYNKDLQVYKMSDELLKLFKLCLHESAVSASNSNINHTQIKTQNQTINSAVDNFRRSRDPRICQKWPQNDFGSNELRIFSVKNDLKCFVSKRIQKWFSQK